MTSVCRMLFFVLVSAAVFLHTSHCGPARSIGLMAARAAKIPRSIRAPFRNTEMMTARGFGKRAQMIKIKEGELTLPLLSSTILIKSSLLN